MRTGEAPAVPFADNRSAAENFRTLVLCGDAWHPAEVVQRGLSALADSRFGFELVTHGGQWSPGIMKDYPLVVVAKANHLSATDQTPWLVAESQRAFQDHVREGGGLMVVHAGTCYRDLSEMRGVTGGAFLRHPDQCVVAVEPRAGHPLTRGMKPFTETDEHYFMALDDAQADVFLHSHSEHGVQPAGWTRTEGKGRVCVLTPGHNAGMWLHREFQILLGNALHWLAKLN